MIIFTGAPVMTMRQMGNPTEALGVVATADAPDGASPPGNTGEAQDNAMIAQNDTSNLSRNISRGACLPFLEDYLHACFSGCGTLHQWVGGVEELLILKAESQQRKIFKECCFQSLGWRRIIVLVLVLINNRSSN
jgi:hypothetical protein